MKNLKLAYRKSGDYYIPNLVLPKEGSSDYQIGKYGHLRLEYLKNNKKCEYELMKIKCILRKHIVEVDLQSKERVRNLINDIKNKECVSEELKDTNPLEWVGMMNNIKNRAEEIVLSELIYV